jgi:predicted transcriptional regulator
VPTFSIFFVRKANVTLREVKEALDAEVLVGEDRLDIEVQDGASADLMSDVLAYAKSGTLLLTGLTNQQVIRTSDVLDIAAVVIVRGKRPSPDTIQLASELGIPILCTKYILYEAVGRLYARGIAGCVEKVADSL